MKDIQQMGMRELFRRSLDGEFGHDVKVNNVIRLLPFADAEAVTIVKYISDEADYFKAHPKDQDLIDFQREAKEWRTLAKEGRAFLKSEGLRAYDEMPKHIWCPKCGKGLIDGIKCPSGHAVNRTGRHSRESKST